MLITCPSCGKNHDSNKHKGAFEIDCDCGYSILIPDEEAIASVAEEGPGFQAPPIALDEEDNQLAVNVGEGTNLATPEPEDQAFAAFDGAISMTPESDLPTGMVYDPDEAAALGESKDAWSESREAEPKFLDPFEQESLDESPVAEESLSALEISAVDEAAERSPAQALLQRNQSAALGHLVGSVFDLSFAGRPEAELLKIAAKCEEVLKQNPWLRQLTVKENSRCEPADFIERKKITRVPEVLALELFLYCFEIGGKCSFAAAEPLEAHAP
ncbi:MAG TPA: hypothetical protein VM901_02210 [Bdellovibrionota bacterium]|jgi:hypothetical protein|nr:hypothetical protein [Bdellovibrionota bacterium]